jgi:VanZ family protein
MDFHRFLKYWLPVILVMLFIFYMSTGTFSSTNTALIIEPLLRFLVPSISEQTVDLIHRIIRKCGHLAEYFFLGTLLFRAFRGGSRESRVWQWILGSGVVVVLYAISDEFHQSFEITRTASSIDVAIDTAGGMVAQIVCAVLHYRGLKQGVPD